MLPTGVFFWGAFTLLHSRLNECVGPSCTKISFHLTLWRPT